MKKNYFIKSRQKLDRCCYRSLIEKLDTSSTQAQSIEIYNFKISRFEIWPVMIWMIRISFVITLVIYKAYFKSHQVRKHKTRTHIFYVKQLRLYTLEFCNHGFKNQTGHRTIFLKFSVQPRFLPGFGGFNWIGLALDSRLNWSNRSVWFGF